MRKRKLTPSGSSDNECEAEKGNLAPAAGAAAWNPLGHFERELSEGEAAKLQAPDCPTTSEPAPFGSLHRPAHLKTPRPQLANLSDVKASLLPGLEGGWEAADPLWQAVHAYRDVHYPIRGALEASKEEEMLCLHILNHCLKQRARVIANNERLGRDPAVEARDQGLTRPKVLVLLPFRSAALRYVETMSRLLFAGAAKEFVTNKARFMDEFAGPEEAAGADKPADYRRLFAGNTDDCFRVGLGIAKKSLKLFVDFYAADILLASPLGLRMAVGAEGEKHHEWDFLSSIQILVLDQADVFLMQNWAHVLHIAEHLHRQPKASHGSDFGRVRLWELNGWGSLYRQTILLAARPAPELRALHTRFGRNYAGLAEWAPAFRPHGLIAAVSPSITQAIAHFPPARQL